MAQKTGQSETSGPPPAANPERAPSTRMAKTAKRLNDAIDRLVDDIDGVLEKNAEDFVRSYVQRGGQ